MPLTGPGAALGADLLDAAQLALFDVGRTDLELLPRDTGDQPQKAEEAARSALDAGAELLVGPLYGRSASAVAPLAAAGGVSVISFSNDASVARPGSTSWASAPRSRSQRVVEYAAARGHTRFAALAPSDAYGTRVLAAWRAGGGAGAGRDGRDRRHLPARQRDAQGRGEAMAAFGRPGGLPPRGCRRRAVRAGAASCRRRYCRRLGSMPS